MAGGPECGVRCSQGPRGPGIRGSGSGRRPGLRGAASFSLGGCPGPCAPVTLPSAAPAPPVPVLPMLPARRTLPGGKLLRVGGSHGPWRCPGLPSSLPLAAPLSADSPPPSQLAQQPWWGLPWPCGFGWGLRWFWWYSICPILFILFPDT